MFEKFQKLSRKSRYKFFGLLLLMIGLIFIAMLLLFSNNDLSAKKETDLYSSVGGN